MLVRNGENSYVGCKDCERRLTPFGTVEQTKAKMHKDCDYKCPYCASIGREIPETDES